MSQQQLVEQVDSLVPACRGRRQQTTEPVPGIVLLRQDQPSPLEASLYDPIVCLILRGHKDVVIGERTLSVGPGECLLVSHHLPVRSRITVAPYLALVFPVDLATVRSLGVASMPTPPAGGHGQAGQTYRADPELLDAFRRYLDLAASPDDAPVLRPLISQEIHYRLMTGPSGAMLRALTHDDSFFSAIAHAIGHIRADLREPIMVPDLARRVGMSPSTFHKHFRSVTATTPLQYQKELRLIEARHLLTAVRRSVTETAFEVGYGSSSQFSREYARKFGVPPSKDGADGE